MLDQPAKCFRPEARCVSGKHQQVAVSGFDLRARGHDRVSRAELFRLEDKLRRKTVQRAAHPLGVLADDDEYVIRLQARRGPVDQTQHRDAADRMQDFGAVADHAGSLARGHHENAEVVHGQVAVTSRTRSPAACPL